MITHNLQIDSSVELVQKNFALVLISPKVFRIETANSVSIDEHYPTTKMFSGLIS